MDMRDRLNDFAVRASLEIEYADDKTAILRDDINCITVELSADMSDDEIARKVEF